MTIAKFEKVSVKNCEWTRVTLPKRATKGSAGYDFYIPEDYIKVDLEPGESTTISTGVRCKIKDGWVLMLFPRSGLGFKGLRLANTTGIIDSDYYYADNEGHIMAKLVNNGIQTITLNGGDRFMQGVFVPYGVAEEEEVTTERIGGMGSTGST